MEATQLYRTLLPRLGDAELAQLQRYAVLFREWNQRLNLVSRKDIDALEEHHILHSLTFARWVDFNPGALVLDFGTGGGLPGIPLAILFPEVRFVLVDSVAKKIGAVEAMARDLGLENVRAVAQRVENLPERFDFVVGRAVATLSKAVPWITPKLRTGSRKANIANGLLYLKGTQYADECGQLGITPDHVWSLQEILPLPYYEEKYLIHIQTQSFSSSTAT